MNLFVSFVYKEFLHIVRDRRTLLILLGIPIIKMLLFGFILTNEIKTVPIAICNLSNDVVTKQICQKLEGSGYFTIKQYINLPDEIHNIFKAGKIKQVIIFEPNFEKKLYKTGIAKIQCIADASDANFANLSIQYSLAIINSYLNELNIDNLSTLKFNIDTQMWFNSELKGVYYFVPGVIALILMLISALMTCLSIVKEKENGTLEMLLLSPLKPLQIILGKVVPYILLSFFNVIIIILMSYFVFGLPIKGNIFLLLFECILFITLALSLGILISTVTRSQIVAMLLSMVGLMLPTILLSGFIFPIENMPRILQVLCAIIPPKYFIIILKQVMLMGNGIAYVWQPTLILIGFTILFLVLATKKFKVRIN